MIDRVVLAASEPKRHISFHVPDMTRQRKKDHISPKNKRKKEIPAASEPFLLVCPTTVISHWQRKLREHAPSLKTVVHHGGNRDLITAVKENDVIITSYGILQRDADLTVPGYLGTDDHFMHRYLIPIENEHDVSRKEELSRAC